MKIDWRASVLNVAVHGDDCDGICSAALVLLKFPNAKIRFLNPRSIFTVDEEFDLVIDLPKPKKCKVNIDHHKSNLERLKKEGQLGPQDIVDPDAPASALLLMKYLNLEESKKAKEIVEIAVAADTARHTEETLILDKIIKASLNNEKDLLRIAKILAERGKNFLSDEWLKKKQKEIEAELSKIKSFLKDFVDSLGVNSGFVIVDEIDAIPYHSTKDIAHMLLDRGCDAVAVLYRDASEPSKIRISIRVRRDSDVIDAEAITRKFGGGGHKKAAGAITTDVKEAIFMLLKEFTGKSPTRSVVFIKLPKIL